MKDLKKRIISSLLAVFLISPFLFSCSRINTEDPIKVYDSETTEEGKDGLELTVKRKKFAFKDENVELLRLENNTDQPIKARLVEDYRDENGKRVYKFMNFIEGIPAHYYLYYLLRPNMAYDKMDLQVRLYEYEDETPMEYIKTGHDLIFLAHAGNRVATMETDFTQYTLQYSAEISSPDELKVVTDCIGLDSEGQIFSIAVRNFTSSPRSSDGITVYDEHFEIPWSDDYSLPENLLGEIYGIVAIESVSLKESP